MKYIFLLLSLFTVIGYSYCFYYEEESRPTYLTAAVGDHVIFNCDLDFPQGIRIPYILNWNKEVKYAIFVFSLQIKFILFELQLGYYSIFVV